VPYEIGSLKKSLKDTTYCSAIGYFQLVKIIKKIKIFSGINKKPTFTKVLGKTIAHFNG